MFVLFHYFFPFQHVSECTLFLVGTISPGEPPRQVSHKAMLDFAEHYKVEYFECELDDVGVNDIVMLLVDNIITGTEHGTDSANAVES